MTAQEFGRYRLLTLLGRGGMGEVWKAVDTEKDREVALKVLGSWLGGDPDFAARFRREAALAARLNSPHIVPIHDYGEIDGRLYIDMALIEGTDLSTLLQHGPLAPVRVATLVTQVARALAVAHRAGLVHRDVKPSNIVIATTDDGEDHAYLIDFGITKALDGTKLSLSGTLIGTPAYMAPECFLGEGDPRSDIYSLGCVLHEALTGRSLFTAPHAFAYAHLHQNVAPPRPSAASTAIAVEWDAVVLRALAKDPLQRYAAVTELAAAARAAQACPAVATAMSRADRTATPSRSTSVGLDHRGAQRVSAAGVEPPVRTRTFRVREGRIAHRTGTVCALAIAVVEKRLVVVTGSTDDTVQIVDLVTRRPVGRPLVGHTDSVNGAATSELDGRPVAVTAGSDKTVRIWDLTEGGPFGAALTGHSGPVNAVSTIRAAGRPIAVTGGSDDTVLVWDLAQVEVVGALPTSHLGPVNALSAIRSNDRPIAVTGSADGSAEIWDLIDHRPVGPLLTGHTGGINAVATTRFDGRAVAVTGGADRTVRVWDLARGQQIGSSLTGHTSQVLAVATTRLDGRPVAVTGDLDGDVRLWDISAGRAFGDPLTGHTNAVFAVAAVHAGDRPVAVTGSADGTVRTWDLLIAAGR